MTRLPIFRSPVFQLALCIVVYLVLVLPTVPVHGVSNDEFIDFRISQTYFTSTTGILEGLDIDPTQARLPMFLTAIGTLVAHSPDYVTARYVSCFFAVLTILGVYLFCVQEFNRRVAFIASAILATSPYFLAFSKAGMTEGDICLSCASILLMLCLAYWRKRPNMGRTVLVGVAAGLTVSTKIIAAVWVPALLPIFLLGRFSKPYNGNRQALLMITCVGVGLLFLVGGFLASGAGQITTMNKSYDALATWQKTAHYSAVFLPWACMVIGGIVFRKKKLHPVLVILLIFSGSLLTFFVIPPAHTTNGSLLQGIFREFVKNSEALSGMAIYSAACLNILSVIIKSGPAIGIFFLLSFFFSFFLLLRKRVLLIPIIFTLVYPAFLIASGRAQTFYMMAILPQLAIIAAFVLSMIYEKSRAAAYVLLILFAANITYDLKVTYPDYHLNGYQYIGERYIAGRSSVGYKGIVQIPSDGTEQVIRWARENIPPGEWVITYLRYRLMIAQLGPSSHTPFHARSGLEPRWDFSKANWVLTHFNYMVDTNYVRTTSRPSIYDYSFDMELLQRDFEKIFSVKRAFGIEVAAVWKRKVPFQY